MNNYLEWSKEYREEADRMMSVIDKYNAQLKGKNNADKRELREKIYKYKTYYFECCDIANHLEARYKGVM